jgi:NAD-dependent deacetylase
MSDQGNQQQIDTLAEWIEQANIITVLTGAGISTESGIPDFRSSDGVWTKDMSREELMSLPYLLTNPEHFWQAYKAIFQLKLQGTYEPNEGHRFFARLERNGKLVNILTQNVDGLHTRAGSQNVYEIHGSMHRPYCPDCGKEYTLADVNEQDTPRCQAILANGERCSAIIHPGIVLFGDQIQWFEKSVELALEADLFMVLGSSLQVSPVNQLPLLAKRNPQCKLVLINRDPTPFEDVFDLAIYAGIGRTVRAVEQRLKSV